MIRLLDASPKQGVGVEFGVYKGGTLDTLATFQPWRAFYGFDTFSGLPLDHWKEGEPHRVGDFRDTGYLAVAELMPSNVTLLPGLFPAVAAGLDIPVGFAHVDFDFELSTAAAIGWLRERVIPGAIVVFDDFDWMHCPGVRKAIEAAGIEVKQSTEHQVFWVAK